MSKKEVQTDKHNDAAPKEKEEYSLADDLLEWCESFVLAIFVVILIFIFILRIVEVSGPSMNPTLEDNDRVIITHINYTPKCGDIIVANSQGLDKCVIKRCIGVSGDTVVVNYSTGTVTVNGVQLEEPYVKEPMFDLELFNKSYKTGEHEYTYHVPENTVFVMGDNRNHSTDGRAAYVGFIKYEDILGKVVFRFLPFDKFGSV